MPWRVLHELGIHYAPAAAHATPALTYPILAQRADDGSTLIVDKLSLAKCVPFSLEYRTLRVARDGRVLYDSQAQGMHDGYGCLMPDGGIALLRVSKWEVVLLSRTGEMVRTLDVATVAKRPPMLVAATDRASLLLAFIDRLFEVEIAEIALDGRLLWYLPAGACRFGCPSSLQRLPNDHVLVADEFCSTVTEIDRAGAIVWRFGRDKDPSARIDRLSNPRFAQQTPDGRCLIADTRNRRVLAIGPDGAVAPIASRETELACPTSAVRAANGNLLVCDAANGRVIELDANGRVAWRFGDARIERHAFSFPRSVERLDDATILVADTAHDRVVRVRQGEVRPWPMVGTAQLFWPRAARCTPRGTLLVADGRNSRVVEISPEGEVLNELRTLQIEAGLPLRDPHDIQLLPGGTLLLTDASLDLVAVVRWDGTVTWSAGRGRGPVLSDPHSAQLLADGSIVICDTGASRVLRLDRDAGVMADVRSLRNGTACYRFSRPRYAEITQDGGWLVVDTGNNRILGADRDGDNAWELSRLPGSPITWINQPRWARFIGRDELLVTDHLHHRVLHLVRGA